jgi:hypothetical protein
VDRTDSTHNALQIKDINCTNNSLMLDQTSPSRCNKPIKTCLIGNFIATKQMGTKTVAEGVQVYSEFTRASPAEKIDKTANLACNLELIGAAVAAQDPTQDKLSLSGLTEGMAMLLQTAIRLMTFMRIVRVLHHLYHSRTLLQVQTRLRRRSTMLKSMILGLFPHMLQLEKGIKAMLRSRNYLRSLSDLIFPMFLHLSLPILCTIAASLILVVCHTCSALMILRLLGTDLAEASLIRALAHFNSIQARCLNKQIPRPQWIKRTLKRHKQTSLTFRYAKRLCQHILMIKIPACITSRWEYLTNTGLRGGGLSSRSSIDSTPRGGGAWIDGTPHFTPQWQFETIPQDIHHEKQESLFCQCHTLSALFRRRIVTGQAMLQFARTQFPLTDSGPLQGYPEFGNRATSQTPSSTTGLRKTATLL